MGDVADERLMSIPGVLNVGRRTGRAELDEHAEGVHRSELDVDLAASARSRAEILHDIRAKLAEIPGVAVSVGQPISHRLDHMLSGVQAAIAVKIHGPDLATLRDRSKSRTAQIIYGLLAMGWRGSARRRGDAGRRPR